MSDESMPDSARLAEAPEGVIVSASSDIAISFLERDEAIARSLKSKLEARWKVFLYSERQRELAGKDGLVALSSLFRDDSRLVVVLFRADWGKTTWTRVEETAIKDRGLEDGWQFLVVVALDSCTTFPAWLPKAKLLVDLERVGPDAAAAIIDARAQEVGLEPIPDDAVSIAAQLAAKATRRNKNRQLLESEAGVRIADNEAATLFEEIRRLAAEMGQHLDIDCKLSPGRRPTCRVRTGRCVLRLTWSTYFSNSLEQSALQVGESAAGDIPFIDTEEMEYAIRFTLDDDGHPAWISEHNEGRLLSSRSLADSLLKALIGRAWTSA